MPTADLTEIVRLYGLRNWVEQSYKQTKGALGWGEYQVRSAEAIRRHCAPVCCAFSFCWSHLGYPAEEGNQPQEIESVAVPAMGGGKNQGHAGRFPATALLASRAACGPGVAGTLDAALALLARVVEQGPTTTTPPPP